MAVHGLSKFERKFNAIPEQMRKNIAAAMEDIADQIVAQMYTAAPHDTGDLAGSIGWTWGDAPSGSLVIGQVGKTEYGAMRITIYAGDKDAFYARFQEFGTVDMPANPFFFPIWRSNKKKIKSRISRAVSKAIKEA